MQRNQPSRPASSNLADPPAAGPANARGEEAAAPGQEETNPPATDSRQTQAGTAKSNEADADWQARLRDLYGGKT
jgi:hypothetical protein